MIDFHTHILPGIDDGSSDVQQSLEMLREEMRLGVRTVVLTPHYLAGASSPAQFLEKRQRAWELLQPHLEEGMPQLLLGAEVHYFEGIAAVADLDRLCVEGTDLLLLEMPMVRWTERMLDAVLEMNRRRFQVVLAHVERYLKLQNKGVVERLLDAGVLFQCNVSFFEGFLSRQKALGMASRGEIHLLGSDCHNLTSRAPNWDKLPEKAAALHSSAERILRRHSRRTP